MSTLKKMTFEELKNLPPLTEEDLRIIREAKPTPTEDCPKQTKEELAMYRPWYEVHPDFYKPKKTGIHMRVDSDVLAWFKKQGKGYQTKMNAVLRQHAFGVSGGEKKAL